MGAAVFGDPEIVGVETSLFVIGVWMIAEDHTDAGIDDLGGDAVAVLVGNSRLGVPCAGSQFVELGASGGTGQLLGSLARRGDKAHRDRIFHSIDDVGIAALVVPYDARGDVFVLAVDPRNVSIGRLHDV